MARLALGTFIVLGSVAGCMVPVAYDVTQSSTIPLPTPTPPPSSRGVVDLYLGASTLTVAEPAFDSDSSLYVPRTQLEGALSAHHSVMGWRILGGLSLERARPSGGRRSPARPLLASRGSGSTWASSTRASASR